MREKCEKKKYRTHPLVKALLALSLLTTCAVALGAYGFWRYAKIGGARDEEARGDCAYEAYVSLCEDIVRGETLAASDALSRCELFTECGGADSLRTVILSERVDETVTEALALDAKSGVSGESGASVDAIARAIRRADEAAKLIVGSPPRRGVVSDGGMWATLECRESVSEDEARKIAERAVGGGVSLKTAENHSFPLVYTFVCKNASADVTRMGGRLIRFYAFRHGDAQARGADECESSARDFVRGAGLSNVTLLSKRVTDDEVEVVFCGLFPCGDENAEALDEIVTLRVARAGACVYFYDAFEYYKNRLVSYSVPDVKINRSEAAKKLGVDAGYLTLAYTGGRLFWRLCGVKTLLLDAETGEITPQNP